MPDCATVETADPRSEVEGLRAENAALAQLLELSTGLLSKRSLPDLLQASVEAAMVLTGAASADFQLYDSANDTWQLAAQRGFQAAFLDQFEWSRRATACACREAQRSGGPVAIEDVIQSPLFRESPEGLALLGAGVRALLATPIAARQGPLLGVLTTCWHVPHPARAATERMLPLLARQLAELIEHRQAEQVLRRSQAASLDAQRRTDEFIAMLGHELRDPLSPILTSLQLMELRGGEMFQDERHIIGRQVQHMARRVDELLEASRIALGRIDLAPRSREVQAVIAQALERATPLLPDRAVQASLEVAPEQPGPRRVLIVEDNPDTAESLASALAILGYAVEVAHDGPSALAKLRGFSPEIALVDIGLPVMGGYELAHRIRAERRSAIRLLAVTGYGQIHDRQRSAEAGFEAHLVKPVDLGVLEGAMQGNVLALG